MYSLTAVSSKAWLIAGFTSLLSLPLQAKTPPSSQDRCELVAFVNETDPAGLNVRAAPSAQAQKLGTLPPIWVDRWQVRHVRVRTHVIDAANGWFKIRNSSDEEDLTEQPARPTYQGEGWVSGSKLIVIAQTNIGRLRPDPAAPAAIELDGPFSFDEDTFDGARRLVDCSGRWIQMEFDESKLSEDGRRAFKISPETRKGLPLGRFRFWVNKICGLQETSCDGL
jgi:hypothetical protein